MSVPEGKPVNDLSLLRGELQEAFDAAQHLVRQVADRHGRDYSPMYTVNGEFGHDRQRWTHWCDGFFPGMMFVFARRTGDAGWLDQAIARSTPLEERRFDRAVHDLGFLFFSTYLRWRQLGGPVERIDGVLHQAGRTMAMRFMERGQYLRSFVEPASLFIDIMMNVGTIFLAGAELADRQLLDIGHAHCMTSRRVLVRGDGSTAHEALFDLETGALLRQSTQQGWRGDSCWSRGLAWSLYGFTRSYQQTGRPEYLQAALLNARYWQAHVPASGVPPWDFDAPVQGPLSRDQVDTSAAAIACSGLLDLAASAPNALEGHACRMLALASLRSLAREYLGTRQSGFEGVLQGGVYHIHKNLGVNEAVAFGDYFFVEALDKALAWFESCDHKAEGMVTPYPEDSLPAQARHWTDGPLPDQEEAGRS